MNTKKIVFVGLCLIVALSMCALAGEVKTESLKAAMDAYNLRMQGKVDDANALLTQAILKNPHNAAAHYELARTRLYMVPTGEPQKMNERISDAQQSIDKAIENDPNNVIYPFFEGLIALMQNYLSPTKENAAKLCGAFESALKLKPDYRQAMLYLVEIYGTLPEDQGGDKSKAEQYAKKLEAIDEVFGAKARWILQPKDANRVEYWQKVMKNHEGNTDVLEEMGKAYLDEDDVYNAVLCFEKAIKIDPNKSFLFMDLSIYHTWAAMRAMKNSELRQRAITAGEAAVTKYLDSNPVLPMRAYAIGKQAMYKNVSGNKELALEFAKKAKALDPYVPMIAGAPHPDFFIAVDEISHNHRYLFRQVQ